VFSQFVEDGHAVLDALIQPGRLKEFASAKDQPELANLALTRFAGAVAGRAVWIAIGNCDARVETACCLRFAKPSSAQKR